MRFTKEQFFQRYEDYLTMQAENEILCNALDCTEWVGNEWVLNYLDLFLEMCDLPDDENYDAVFDMIDNRACPDVIWDYINEAYGIEG